MDAGEVPLLDCKPWKLPPIYLLIICLKHWGGWDYLSELGSGNPSNSHRMVGGGLPFAMHFKEMAGPGCKVCSVNLKRKKGRASERWKKGVFIIYPLTLDRRVADHWKRHVYKCWVSFSKHCYFQAKGIASSISLQLLHHFACTHFERKFTPTYRGSSVLL